MTSIWVIRRDFKEGHPVHTALARLRSGDRLTMNPAGAEGLGLFDRQGICVARLSRKAVASWRERLGAIREIRVLAVVHRSAEQEADPERRSQCRVAEWEIPVVEVVFEEDS